MVRVAFKCLQSGNVVSFSDVDDIESMRKEQHYEEIKYENAKTNEQTSHQPHLAVAKNDDRASQIGNEKATDGSIGPGDDEAEKISYEDEGHVAKRRGRPRKIDAEII